MFTRIMLSFSILSLVLVMVLIGRPAYTCGRYAVALSTKVRATVTIPDYAACYTAELQVIH